MQADNNKCGVGVAYNSKVGGKIFFYYYYYCKSFILCITILFIYIDCLCVPDALEKVTESKS